MTQTKITKIFNALTFPLTGRRLIEASAGTGKTYNIANLYLRLLTGDDCTPKTVDQILVVTFTRAATDELRGRIREKIEQALQAFRGDECKDEFIQKMIDKKQAEKQETCRSLNNALVCMDEACIFTIHGFAVRAIKAFLFETGALAEVELSEEGNARRVLVLADLWRQLKLTGNPKLREYAEAVGFGERGKFDSYFSKDAADAVVLPDFQIDTSQSLEKLLESADKLVSEAVDKALETRKELAARWKKIGDETSKSIPDHPKRADLIRRIDAWLVSDELSLTLPGLGTQIYEYMMSFRANPLSEDVSQVVCAILDHVESSQSLINLQQSTFRALLLQYVQIKMKAIDISSMHVDEVILLINHVLEGKDEKSTQLKQIITAAYPVCMVDEFQDTSPAQFNMFNRLYAEANDSGFFMIGDPKQSIYQFRGADIFSYLSVKQEVRKTEADKKEQHIYPLDTNYRSKQSLVDATNALFQEQAGHPTFVFKGIEYEAVKSCEADGADKGCLYDAPDAEDGSLIFVGNHPQAENDKLNGDTLRWKYAKDTAQRIQALLAQATIERKKKGDDKKRPLRGSDIAVLVKSGREAKAVRYALLALQPRIGSVYQSQKDSVFGSSVVAEDLYHILCAMDDPKDKSQLKKAMATLFFRGFECDFSELDTLDAGDAIGDATFENLIAEFEGYRTEWEAHGVLAAMVALVRHRKLLHKMAALPDCDRLVTDFRHLGEILQDQEMECGSRKQLMIWYSRQLLDDSEMESDSKRIRLESDENLVKVVTIHVSKGLEYPIVFLPFFYMPWSADLAKNVPLHHPENSAFRAVIDYTLLTDDIKEKMQKEMRAEDMRLLYVAVTRAIHQCYIGISASTSSKQPQFSLTVWKQLLGIKTDSPTWTELKAQLEKKLAVHKVAYQTLFSSEVGSENRKNTNSGTDAPKKLVGKIEMPKLNESNWIITSYSALAHGKKISHQEGDETAPANAIVVNPPAQPAASDDIRFRLRGSNRTGDCIHEFFEELALDPEQWLATPGSYDDLLQKYLRKHGLEKPEGKQPLPDQADKKEAIFKQRRKEITEWFDTVLDVALLPGDKTSSLRCILLGGQAMPEMAFDFSLGSAKPAPIKEGINSALKNLEVAPVVVPFKSRIEGLMTGSIDLIFIHDQKVYVLDYKSNTLGKSVGFYSEPHMSLAMQAHRFDLQGCIYSVAAHRYMQQRLGDRYAFDEGGYCFGGTIYLFLRGIGTGQPGCDRHGIWFKRPDAQGIANLDAAFKGTYPSPVADPELNHG